MTEFEAHERRVIDVIRDEACEALDRGAARLTTTTAKELYGSDSVYDAMIVILEPANPRAARVVIELQDTEQWWLSAAGGPPYEFYPGLDDRFERLRHLVAAVVAGGFEQRPGPGRAESVFQTGKDTVVTSTTGKEYALSDRRTYEPY